LGSASIPNDNLTPLVVSLRSEGGFCFTPTREAIHEFANKRKLEKVELYEPATGGAIARLIGGDPAATPGGLTGGFTIRVPDAFEHEVSERRVRVQVLARALGGGSTRMAVAYSTADVGNSGWRWFDVANHWAVYELVWDVPKMVNGNGDYVGLLPDKHGQPGVDIRLVSATVL
jgi:hypothetical protein